MNKIRSRAWEILGDSTARLSQSSRQEDLSASEVAEDAGETLELFYQCRCGDYFSVDLSKLQKMGYSLLRDGSNVSVRNADALPGSVILPCESCSLKARLVLSIDDSWNY
ncbi:uncharacterized protein LOC131605252 [Vicia villosa]|uniref:uncharacterized protein LOC131605252 n=1 Tax=Vicia villosa TaxID=3911 RepID=UPI00273BB10A|nr:uncharacterized protein LOC131605252 [Vicia villosa]